MEPESAPFLLIFREESASAVYKAMSPEQRQQLLQQWNDWCNILTAQGKLQQGRPLAPGGWIVSSAAGHVVDGPFVETKEAIGGFFLLTVAGLDEAVEIAKQCPSLRFGLTIEVRGVAGTCPSLHAQEQVEPLLVNA
ncbi:MAG TPA: YciI family protein [Chthoniobacterales bacterium]